MLKNNYETLSLATNALSLNGYTESFNAEDSKIVGLHSNKKYTPDELKIAHTYRFEGMTNPQDDAVVFAIETNDGAKGTLIMSYSSKHNQNVELIKKIPKA